LKRKNQKRKNQKRKNQKIKKPEDKKVAEKKQEPPKQQQAQSKPEAKQPEIKVDAPNKPAEPAKPKTNEVAASFKEKPKDQVGIDGDRIAVTCKIIGKPKPKITWSKKTKKH